MSADVCRSIIRFQTFTPPAISNCVANKVCKVTDCSLFFDLDLQGHFVTSSVVESEGELTNEFELTTRL